MANFLINKEQTLIFFTLIPAKCQMRGQTQSFWLQIQKSRVRFQALPDFLRSRGSGTGSTQPREDN
jgi:hypothetical protein